jgi:hypothetical protein
LTRMEPPPRPGDRCAGYCGARLGGTSAGRKPRQHHRGPNGLQHLVTCGSLIKQVWKLTAAKYPELRTTTSHPGYVRPTERRRPDGSKSRPPEPSASQRRRARPQLTHRAPDRHYRRLRNAEQSTLIVSSSQKHAGHTGSADATHQIYPK